MSWLGKPDEVLPPPVVLSREGGGSYISGKKDNGWITWDSRQKVPENHFMNKDWYNLPFGFQGTRNLIMKINLDFEKNRRYNFRTYVKLRGIPHDQLNYDEFGNRFPHHNLPAFGSWMGGTPCLVWQVGLGGTWCLVTRYGVIEGVKVSIQEEVEWQLRHGLLIGFIWFLNRGNVPTRGSGTSRLMRGLTVFDWDDVHLELWGQALNSKFIKRKGKAITIAGEKWSGLSNYHDKIRVGKYNVVPNDLFPDNGGKKEWKKWLEDAVNKGKNIGWQTPVGFRYETGTDRKTLPEEEYKVLYEKVRKHE